MLGDLTARSGLPARTQPRNRGFQECRAGSTKTVVVNNRSGDDRLFDTLRLGTILSVIEEHRSSRVIEIPAIPLAGLGGTG